MPFCIQNTDNGLSYPAKKKALILYVILMLTLALMLLCRRLTPRWRRGPSYASKVSIGASGDNECLKVFAACISAFCRPVCKVSLHWQGGFQASLAWQGVYSKQMRAQKYSYWD